jgi:CRISPR-associated protein Csh2
MNQSKKFPVKRAQLVFIYTSKDDLPNGDPFTGQQRFDEATSRIQISDVRIKRYIRDYFLDFGTQEIYMKEIDRDELDKLNLKKDQKLSGSSAQIKILMNKYGVANAKDAMLKCIDARGFGGVSTDKGNNAALTGPIQFENLNSSLNMVELKPNQNTSVFESDMDKSQGAIGTSTLVPFALNQITGNVSPVRAAHTGLIEAEVMLVLDALWNSLNICSSRSKQGQDSRLLLKLNLNNPAAKIADMSEKIRIQEEDTTELRSISQVTWDYSRLVKTISTDKVETVEYRAEDAVVEEFLKQMAPVKSKMIEF